MVEIADMVPGGIKPTDHWHLGTYDETCSRCRQPISDDDVPLLLWANDRHDMLAYCETCLGTRDAWDAARAAILKAEGG